MGLERILRSAGTQMTKTFDIDEEVKLARAGAEKLHDVGRSFMNRFRGGGVTKPVVNTEKESVARSMYTDFAERPFANAPSAKDLPHINGEFQAGQNAIGLLDGIPNHVKKSDPQGLFGSIFDNSKWARPMVAGAGIGLAATAIGSGIYGASKMALPNNTSVDNPLRNVVKGVAVGASIGALFAASRSVQGIGRSMVKSTETYNKLFAARPAARMVTNALDTRTAHGKLMVGALATAGVAMSGDFNFTKPVNPVY